MVSKRRPSFNPKLFLASAGDGRSIDTYRKGQVVFAQKDPANAVFYIQSGNVKVAVTSNEGREAVVAILGANDFFGERCLDGPTQRMTTVTTMTESVIVQLGRTAIVRVIHQEPAFRKLFIGHLLRRAGRLEADLADHLSSSSEKRLARLLLLLASPGRDGKRKPTIPKISQETLAGMIGTTRSRVSHFMNRFRDLGYIGYNGGASGRIDVHDSLSNVVRRPPPLVKA